MKNIFLFLLATIILQACNSGQQEQLVSVDNKYSLSIPAFLSKTDDLNEDASLEYQNPLREFYVITIDESKKELDQALIDNDLTDYYENNIEGYSDLILEGLHYGLKNAKTSNILDTTVNKMPAKLTSISGEVDGFEIFYYIGIYEGKDRFYQVLTWTLNNRKSMYKSQMEKILHSLKEK